MANKSRTFFLLLVGCIFFVVWTIGCVSTPSKPAAAPSPKVTPVPPPKPKAPPKPVEKRYHSLSEITDAFSKEISKNLSAEQKIYLDRAAIRDTITKDLYNFSAYLQLELESSLSRQNCAMIYDPDEADHLIGAAFRKAGDTIWIYLKYHQSDMSGRKAFDYKIKQADLPEDAFREDLKSKAFNLVTDILQGQEKTKVYVRPIIEGNEKYVSEFSNVFINQVKTQIVRRYKDVEIIDEKPIEKGVASLRGIGKKEKKVKKNLEAAEAQLTDADSVLEGKYFVVGDAVTVSLFLKKTDARLLNSSSVDIKRQFIAAKLDNPEAQKLTDLADIRTEKGSADVRIFSTKGGDFPIFYDKEKIKFYIQVSQPLYVYLYDINTKGEVTLLYPYDENDPQQRLQAGKIYSIPDENDDFEFEVEPPFGMDAVKIFASGNKLPIPSLSTRVSSQSYRGATRDISSRGNAQARLAGMQSINPKDLVDYYRGVAGQFGSVLYEDSLILETKTR